MATVAVTDASFESDVLKSDKPVVVDFWAEWCGPCKQIGPSLEEIAKEMGEEVVIAKVNIDDNPNAPSRYGVRGIPTMILFKDGEAASTKVGAAPKTAIESWIRESI
ncbi:MAG: thioredoxin [Pseudomonadota bacterium]